MNGMRLPTFRSVVTVATALLAIVAAAGGQSTLAIRGDVVHTMAGEPIRDGIVLIEGGKIALVGPAASTTVPVGVKTLAAKVVTPGLIDARTIIGLQGYQHEARENDVLERSAPMQPELRAFDAFNGRERLLEWVRGFGITTIHTGFAPGALVTGQSMVIKTRGPTVDDGLLKSEAMLLVTFGEGGLNRGEGGRAPGTRAKQLAMLRQELIKAREAVEKQQRPASAPARQDDEDEDGRNKSDARDLRQETLIRALKKELPLLIYAQRAQDILAAIKLKQEYDVNVVLDGGAEAYLLIDQIKAAQIPVIVHATMKRASGETENLSFETAGKLKAAGIQIAMQSGYEEYVPKTRVVLLETAQAVANGLKPADALAALTIDAARILGVSDRVGSIEPGKDADLALFDGDPFEYVTRCTGTIIDGQLVHDRPR